MASAGGVPRQKMASVGTSIVPPGPARRPRTRRAYHPPLQHRRSQPQLATLPCPWPNSERCPKRIPMHSLAYFHRGLDSHDDRRTRLRHFVIKESRLGTRNNRVGHSNSVRRSSQSEHGHPTITPVCITCSRWASWPGRYCDGGGMSDRDGGLLAAASPGDLRALKYWIVLRWLYQGRYSSPPF